MSDRSDVEALIARIRYQTGNRASVPDLLFEAADALELLLSPTPTGDERERMIATLLPRLSAGTGCEADWNASLAEGQADDLIAAGFRVAPEPVYEYRGRITSRSDGRVRFHVWAEEETAKVSLTDLGPEYRVAIERRVKAGEPERLPVEGEK